MVEADSLFKCTVSMSYNITHAYIALAIQTLSLWKIVDFTAMLAFFFLFHFFFCSSSYFYY